MFTISRKKIFMAVMAFVFAGIAFPAFSQSVANQPESGSISSLETDEALMPIGRNSEQNIVLQNTGVSGGGNTSGIGVFFRMFFVLLLVAVAIFFIFKFFKKTVSPEENDDTFLRKVSGITLSPGKSVQIVTLIDSAYLIGVSDNNINLIEKIQDKELVNALNLYADKNAQVSKPKTFSEVLDIFTGARKGKEDIKKDDQESSTEEILSSLRNNHITPEAE